MPDSAQHTAGAKRSLGIWGIIAIVLVIVSGVGRLLLFLIAGNHHAKSNGIPTWPVQAGDVFPVRTGDPQIAKWAIQPDNDGFLVELVEQDGQKTTPKVCALQPDYMTASGQPGGSLTVLAQARQGEWRVHWQGGDTLPGEGKPEQIALNCGHNAVVLMTSAELLSWLKMQTGEPDEYPVMSNDKMYMDLPPDTSAPAATDAPPALQPAAAPPHQH